MHRWLAGILGLLVGGVIVAVTVGRSAPPGSVPDGTDTVPTAPDDAGGRRLGPGPYDGPVPAGVDADAIGAALPTAILGDLRLVSLSPAMSRIAVDLGLEPAIVGRSRFCTFLDPAIPVAGDLIRIDAERLVALRPTHVLRQPPSSDDSDALRRLADEQAWTRPILARLERIDDVRAFVRGLPRRVAEPGTTLEQALLARASAIDVAMGRLLAPPAAIGAGPGGDEPREAGGRDADDAAAAVDVGEGGGAARQPPGDPVLLVTGIRPATVFGRRTYLDDLLAARGARNVFTGMGWRTLSGEDLLRLDPPAIVLVTDDPDAADDLLAEARRAWAILGLSAVDTDRVTVLAHREVMRPSTGLLEIGPAFALALRRVGAGYPGQPGAPAIGGDRAAIERAAGATRSPGPSPSPPPPLPGDRVGPGRSAGSAPDPGR